MAVFYELRWAMTGFPDAFLVFRWEQLNSTWYVIDAWDGEPIEPLASFRVRNPFTLNMPNGHWWEYRGLVDPNVADPEDQSMEDYYASFQWGSHYQVVQYYQSVGQFSHYTQLNPTVDPLWGTQTPSDHLMKVRRRYYDGIPQVRTLTLMDSETNAIGKLEVTNSFFGKSYQTAMGDWPLCEKSEMLEIIGEDIKLNADVWIRDISGNILVWT